MPGDADDIDPVKAWDDSGVAAITGGPDGQPLLPPPGFVERLAELTDRLVAVTTAAGARVDLDGLHLLQERAAIAGFGRGGTTTCGGAGRLLRTADGWIAASLPRPEDRDLVPAWLGTELVDHDHPAPPGPAMRPDDWAIVADRVAARPAGELVAWAVELGLPVAELGERTGRRDPGRRPVGAGAARADVEGLRVVDLSSLWAGPLCGAILSDAGADVVKVESTQRPDGARTGPSAFFDLVNAGKRCVAVDLSAPGGAAALAALLDRADVVIEGSRPRALRQLGIDADAWLTAEHGRVWLSITGHGRGQPNRTGFGDDAAVAGGLVAWEDGEPRFCGDAIADPLSGLSAAVAGIEAVLEGRSVLIDIALAERAAWFAGREPGGDTAPAAPPPNPVGRRVAAPTARRWRGVAPALGAHTAAVFAEWGVAGPADGGPA